MSDNSFDARTTLRVGDRDLDIFRLDALQSKYDVARLPFSLKVLLENLLRTEGNGAVTKEDIEALASWDAKAEPANEIAFSPARVVMQDFTGVPAIVDLAAMRDAMADELGSDSSRIVARSTMQGTPVKSCMTTRAGVNWISWSGSADGSQFAIARMWSAVMSSPSSVRSRFSSRTLRLKGSFSEPSTASSRKMS